VVLISRYHGAQLQDGDLAEDRFSKLLAGLDHVLAPRRS
jgi:hypothetical protein